MLSRRSALAGLGVALAIGLASQPAHAAPTTDEPAPAAAGWLADQLVDGERFETEFEGDVFPDQPLTIDSVLAFAATGVAGSHADAAMTWLARPEITADYLGHPFDSKFANGHSKLTFVVLVQGLDPTSFGGVDLEAELRSLEQGESDPEPGRVSDQSAFDDISNAFSQSFALLALSRTDGGVTPAAVDFLVSEQCPDGSFQFDFDVEPCAGEVDSTAMVIQALLAVGQSEVAESALDWLSDQQQQDGSYNDGNANSTGLAAQALRAGDRDAAADRAVAYLEELQIGCDGPEDQRGAIPLSADNPGDVPRATAQALLGLAGVAMADLDGTNAQAEAPLLQCEAAPSPTPSEPGGKGGELPVTGDPVLVLVAVGAALAGAGGVTVWATRFRRRGAGTPSS